MDAPSSDVTKDGAAELCRLFVVATPSPNTSSFVYGYLSSKPNRTYLIDLYDNDAIDPTWYGEGARHAAAVEVTTDGSGYAWFGVNVSGWLTYITATATDVLTGETSEFSEALTAPISY